MACQRGGDFPSTATSPRRNISSVSAKTRATSRSQSSRRAGTSSVWITAFAPTQTMFAASQGSQGANSPLATPRSITPASTPSARFQTSVTSSTWCGGSWPIRRWFSIAQKIRKYSSWVV